jgi:hypothetical protein
MGLWSRQFSLHRDVGSFSFALCLWVWGTLRGCNHIYTFFTDCAVDNTPGYPVLASDEVREVELQMEVRRSVKEILLQRRDDAHLCDFYSQETIFNEANQFGDYDSTWGLFICSVLVIFSLFPPLSTFVFGFELSNACLG